MLVGLGKLYAVGVNVVDKILEKFPSGWSQLCHLHDGLILHILELAWQVMDAQVGWSLGSAEALGEVDVDVEGEE